MSKRKSQEVLPDQGSKDTPDHRDGFVPERALIRSDFIDATPCSPPNNISYYEAPGGTPCETPRMTAVSQAHGVSVSEIPVQGERTSGPDEHAHLEETPRGISAAMPVLKAAERYNMSHQNRGICLVLNHKEFESKKEKREGTDVDVERIKTTFTNLGFSVVVRHNLKYRHIEDEIENLSMLENHENNDCVCVFVLTHGKADGHLMAHDVSYPATKIWKPFSDDKCPTLAGKPKLFFFQACRGNQLDSGVNLVFDTYKSNGDQIDMESLPYTIPTLSDFLIGHSCTDGCVSWRNQRGTIYIQTLCDVIDEFGETTDLLKMLTITARRVAIDYNSVHDKPKLNAKKQAPSVLSTLTRDLYFEPKKTLENRSGPVQRTITD